MPATHFNDLHTQLNGIIEVWQLQPAELLATYKQTAQYIVTALTNPTYSFAVYLPDQIVLEPPTVKSTSKIEIRAGNMISRLRKISCRDSIIHSLKVLQSHSDPIISWIAQLINYSSAECILTGYLPTTDKLRTEYKAFEPRKWRLLTSEPAAVTIIEKLESFVDLLLVLETILPPITASDLYKEQFNHLTAHLTDQARALAHYYVGQMIEEIQIGWLKGTISHGLTLHIPYFNEHDYRLLRYQVVVTPSGRVHFRPEFIVSACRIAEREVRQDTQMAQSSRWELITHLDRLVHAFEPKEPEIIPD
jgi:hypothetical protein